MSLFVTVTRHLLWVVIPLALCAIGVVANKSNMEIQLIAGSLDYTNPEFVLPGAYLRISRKSRKSLPVMNAVFPLKKDLPPETKISWHCFQKINNAWVPTIVKGSVQLCEMLESKNKLQRAMFDASNMPTKCPVRKANYTFKDFHVKTDGLPPVIPGSEWKAISNWGIAKANILVYNFEVKIFRKGTSSQSGTEASAAIAING